MSITYIETKQRQILFCQINLWIYTTLNFMMKRRFYDDRIQKSLS